MSRPSSRLLAATRTQISYIQPTTTFTHQCARLFSQTCLRQSDPERSTSLLDTLPRVSKLSPQTGPPRPKTGPPMLAIHRILAHDSIAKARNQPTSSDDASAEGDKNRQEWGPPSEPFHFHIYAHKHNLHITVTKPNRDAIINMSAGNIGFRKSKRGSYDAAYQLTAYVIDKLHQGSWHKNITTMEVILAGFGSGREAATKVLLGSEGRMLRDKIIKVSDSTKLKFGGTRSRKPRRLG